jgi:hypothetical protein
MTALASAILASLGRRKRGRPILLVPCGYCGAIITRTEYDRGAHDGCTHRNRFYTPRGTTPPKPPRTPRTQTSAAPAQRPRLVKCRYCDAMITRDQWWHGHEGCERRGLRRYTGPGRRAQKPLSEEITFNWTREEISAKIAAMPAKRTARLMAKLGWR